MHRESHLWILQADAPGEWRFGGLGFRVVQVLPSALNPKPEALNPKPQNLALNHLPLALNCKRVVGSKLGVSKSFGVLQP